MEKLGLRNGTATCLRRGWTRTTMKLGDEIEVNGSLARTEARVNARSVVMVSTANAWCSLERSKASPRKSHFYTSASILFRFGGHDVRNRLIIVCSALVLALITVLILSLLTAQASRAQGQIKGKARARGKAAVAVAAWSDNNQPSSKPTPRWPDGRPMIGAPAGEKEFGVPAAAISRMRRRRRSSPGLERFWNIGGGNEFEPHTRCKPSGGARQFVTPYGTEIVEAPDLQKVFIFDIGGPHTFRETFLMASRIRRIWSQAITAIPAGIGKVTR